MPTPQIVSLPPDFELADGMSIVITAVDPTTNATVSGVAVSGVSIDVDPYTAATEEDRITPTPLLVPAD